MMRVMALSINQSVNLWIGLYLACKHLTIKMSG